MISSWYSSTFNRKIYSHEVLQIGSSARATLLFVLLVAAIPNNVVCRIIIKWTIKMEEENKSNRNLECFGKHEKNSGMYRLKLASICIVENVQGVHNFEV